MASLIPHPDDYGLLTDLYQLTMSACYVGEGLDHRPASFELFARRLPDRFGYLIAMGLEDALDYLSRLRFGPEQITALKNTGIFDQVPDRFWQVLAEGHFTGDVWAVPEGTAVFANEPLLRIEAPLWQAQLVETYLLNTLNYQTLIATRSARLRDVAGSAATLLEFGTRRAFSPQGALWAARAAIAAGFDATSNVLAAVRLGSRPAGTMAHALVMALSALEDGEDAAFDTFHRYFPNTTLLIDTYDAMAAAQRLATQVAAGTRQVPGVRLDSGDLAAQSRQVRSLLPHTKIVASGDLDEYEIVRLQEAGACIDAYGLGTRLVTGDPVNGVYKLVEIDGIPTMKQSASKVTYPGRKQIFRQWDGDRWLGDTLGLITETPPTNTHPLMIPVMKQGERVLETEDLAAIAHRTRQSVQSLPAELRDIHQPKAIAPHLSLGLQTLVQTTQAKQYRFYTDQNSDSDPQGFSQVSQE